MASFAVVGLQWGDEGKGKVVDYLSESADVVVRYQGGPNAGHTVCFGDRRLTLHQVPSGMIHPQTLNIIGPGCVVDPGAVSRDLKSLRRVGVRTSRRLIVDRRAHLIMPYHRELDRRRDEQGGRQRIGTTGQGIGPAYVDKVARVGIRVVDLLDEEKFKEKFRRNASAANFLLMELHDSEPLPLKETMRAALESARFLTGMIGDGSARLESALRSGARVLFEGAQGTFLDLDMGTYPYVTSSSSSAAGVPAGAGISPLWLDEVVGVSKAYTTRVGEGPFPTEMAPADAEHLRTLGAEFGATTGRPRRCGWFDAPLVRAAVRYNGCRSLAITKLDILDSMAEIKVCTGYRVDGGHLPEFDSTRAGELVPVYETMPGWLAPTGNCRAWRELPLRARRYLDRLAELVECQVGLVSVGMDRAQTIVLDRRLAKWLR